MYVQSPYLEIPKNQSATIWRYMDFTKFVSLLDRRELFFARTDKLGDPFEGSCPKKSLATREKIYGSKDVGEFFKLVREFTAVNCWHLSKYESAAMWKLHLKSDEGIAIKSSFRRLKGCLEESNLAIYIGKVQYIDYENDEMPIKSLAPFFHKRKSFRHESELRACTQKFPKKRFTERSKRPFDEGVYVPVNLDKLIRDIYLAPQSPEWLLQLVRSVTNTYKLGKEVIPSSLDTSPIY